MAMEIVLEDEDGTAVASVEDPTNILQRMFPSPEDTSFRYLNDVDWSGSTTFNWIQCKGVKKELEGIAEVAVAADERALVEQLIALAGRCASGLHLYLKFYGD